MKAVERGEVYSLDEVWEHLGLPPRKRDLEEEKLSRAMFKAKRNLDIYCRERELNEIRRAHGKKEHPFIFPQDDEVIDGNSPCNN